MDADEVAENIMRVREAVAAYNAGDVESYANLYADPVTAVDTVTGDRTEVSRADGITETQGFRDAFSDHVCTIRQLTAQGDNVMVRFEYEGTDDRAGVVGQPTGRRATWPSVSEYRFEDGVVVEVAAVTNLHALFRQLGYEYHLPSSDESEGQD